MLSKNPEVGIWRIPTYTPQYTTDNDVADGGGVGV